MEDVLYNWLNFCCSSFYNYSQHRCVTHLYFCYHIQQNHQLLAGMFAINSIRPACLVQHMFIRVTP
ncbi:MAG: hypothetical protein JWQ96_641 [Segetibacter sp.]|nr:hypothetical protein [Segetibacter sp.]